MSGRVRPKHGRPFQFHLRGVMVTVGILAALFGLLRVPGLGVTLLCALFFGTLALAPAISLSGGFFLALGAWHLLGPVRGGSFLAAFPVIVLISVYVPWSLTCGACNIPPGDGWLDVLPPVFASVLRVWYWILIVGTHLLLPASAMLGLGLVVEAIRSADRQRRARMMLALASLALAWLLLFELWAGDPNGAFRDTRRCVLPSVWF